MNNHRQQRLASLLLEEMRIMVSSELEDPAMALVDVTDVVVSKDLRNVKVYVSHPADEELSRKDVLQRLQKATSFLRRRVAERLTLRAVPELSFFYDETPERASRLNELFKKIADERNRNPTEPPTNA